MKYVETLKPGDTAYVWNGDVRYSVKVKEVDTRYIHTSSKGRFGRRTGKGIEYAYMHLANAAGEKEINQ